MYVDMYGNKRHTAIISPRTTPTDISTENGAQFVRYETGTGTNSVTKITISGGTQTVRWGRGTWANRASITYENNPNECIVED